MAGRIRSRLPRAVRSALGGGARAQRAASGTEHAAALLLELARTGPAPLLPGGTAPGAPLSVAAVIPSFRRGSGGHATIVRLLEGLQRLGHTPSVWLEDCEGRHRQESTGATEASFREFFAAGPEIEVHADLGAWRGADVVLGTGWQTVARAMLLPGCRGRAYLVQDHEPDFYASSAEALWAAQTYAMGLHCIAASPWLAAMLQERYGARASHFDLAVDHAIYRPAPDGAVAAEPLVAFYARAVTPRRAVPLGLLALEELSRRRPGVGVALYGEDRPLPAPFEHRALGVLGARALADLYTRASVGVVLSLTNPSLIGLEMMACGLPCVELASESMLATFGREGPLTLAEPDALALCGAIESLLDDPALRARASVGGLELMAARTWEHAAMQVEHGLREALSASSERARERTEE